MVHLKDELMPRYASLIYNGYWWSPERTMLQTMIDASQANVNGKVRLKLYKGNVIVVGGASAPIACLTKVSLLLRTMAALTTKKMLKALSN